MQSLPIEIMHKGKLTEVIQPNKKLDSRQMGFSSESELETQNYNLIGIV